MGDLKKKTLIQFWKTEKSEVAKQTNKHKTIFARKYLCGS